MQKLSCPRCENPFYTAARPNNLPCPFCGNVIRPDEPDRRLGDRYPTQKGGDIVKGDVRVPVKTVDLSPSGLGIKMMGYLPFEQNEKVTVLIKDLEIDRVAEVVWTKNFYGISRAGLRFCA